MYPQSLLVVIFFSVVYRTRIQNFQKLEQDLILKNAELREMITKQERTCHDTVADNIRRFEQFKVVEHD